jgi:Tol biopolymer transport system component
MTISPRSYLGSPGRPSWSTDSSKVAVNLNRQAVVVDRESERIQTRIGPEGANIGAPQFSPISDKLLFDIYTSVPGADKKQWAIQVANADGSEPTFLVDHGRTPQWSPDGSRIAFSSYTDDFQTKVSTVNADGTEQRVVSERPHASDFSWSPDGTKIAYEAANDKTYDLRTVDLESGIEKTLSDGEDGTYWDRSPAWSPTGQTIAFERRHKRFPAGSLWTVEADTGLEKQLFQKFADVVDPVYSPDGQTLVFGSNHGGRGGLDLFSMDLENLQVTQLTDIPGDEHSPSFSPDGRTLAFLNTDRKRPSQARHQLHFREPV